MVIAHNISALNTYKSLGIAGNSMQSSMEKLSSGYKINKAGDDAAGLSISEKMRSQIRGLNQASTNAENGVSMIQTAEGALNEQHSILQRMRELAVQAATDTNASEDREALQSEMVQLTNEINRIAATTEFNGMKILNGDKGTKWDAKSTLTIATSDLTAVLNVGDRYGDWEVATAGTLDTNSGKLKNFTLTSITNSGTTGTVKLDINGVECSGTAASTANATDGSVYFHVGANSNQVINTEFNNMDALTLGVARSNIVATSKQFSTEQNVTNGTGTAGEQYALNVTTREGANAAIDIIDHAIKKVSEERSKYGAIQNRLEYTMNNLNTTAENMTAAESTIRDVDMAEEMMEYTKNNILQQAAQAMLVQANARPQQALQLLQ